MSKDNFAIFCWVWIGIALLIIPVVSLVTQPYGRHSKTNWGPMINNSIAWFLMEAPALLVFAFFVISSESFNNLVLSAISLWVLHYFHRAIIYPLRIRTKDKKMPIIIMVFGVFFNTVNGFLNGYWLAHFAPEIDSTSHIYTRIVLGAIIFLIGYMINKYHDRLLINLRKGKGDGYKIPFGGLFKYISCPNFFGEIISWLGFLILCYNLPALSFLIWTMVNLVPRALDHHKWYKNEFSDYPDERKAIFPYLL